jgi:hypothetical protein
MKRHEQQFKPLATKALLNGRRYEEIPGAEKKVFGPSTGRKPQRKPRQSRQTEPERGGSRPREAAKVYPK